MIPLPNEGVATYTRTTINGRKLSYRLKVVQQPEKARACGSGPRSSADRRPVDPPPVVKLTVYEGSEDITIRYDASFMLYASLDVARPIANGRMHNPQVVPVLTGVAVAGVAYLERPKQAGYFIFPDLSVRHEGWYRLRFHLFEQVKHSEDADKDRPFEVTQASTSATPQEPAQHEAMANRMFVHSAPFQVFSAKKFPGLNTSTELSKVVADQGCRVRIRREIRQRRKPKGKDEGEDDHRKSINGTPEPITRNRSLSKDGTDNSHRVSIDLAHQQLMSRRSSMEHTNSTTPLIGTTLSRAPPSISSPITNLYQQSDQRSVYRPEMDNKIYTSVPQTPMLGFPQTMTPTAEQSGFTLPPISSLYDVTSATQPRPRAYNLPDPVPQKRSYSPRTYKQDLSLKDGARPDSLPSTQPLPPTMLPRQAPSHAYGWSVEGEKARAQAHIGQSIEADNDPCDYDSDSEDSILEGPFTYRRADGTRSGKPLITPSNYQNVSAK